MLSVPPAALTTATPLGVAPVATAALRPARWRHAARRAARVIAMCVAPLAISVAIGFGVAGAFTLVAIIAS